VKAGRSPDWRRLFRIAIDLMAHVNRDDKIIDEWSFGGGTAMMLQIGHRDSHDVDIFLTDAQLLGYLDPARASLRFSVVPDGYEGDGTKFQKFAYSGLGEVDFIVGQLLTRTPLALRSIEGIETPLETVPEIVAKKIYYRGASIRPRDIFDIAAAAETYEGEIIHELRRYRSQVEATLSMMGRLNIEFVSAAIDQLMIRPKYTRVASAAIGRTIAVLKAV
jgi:hypothetical protein